jgi:DNA-binding XRE family transcriptional regulator
MRRPRVSYVVSNDRPTHVILSIADYRRLLNPPPQPAIRLSKREALRLRRIEESAATEWIPADQARLGLAARSLAEARIAAGLTQKQLGDRVGVPQSQISRVEKNPDKTTVRTLRKIAAALGVDVSAFL